MQSELQRPQQQQQARRQGTDEQTVTFEAPSAPQEDHNNAFNPDSVAIETYLSSLGLSDKMYMPNIEKNQPSQQQQQQQQQQTPLIQVKKEPQKIIQNIPQLVPNNYASATVTPTLSTSPNTTTTTAMNPPSLQPIMYAPQQMMLPQQPQQQQTQPQQLNMQQMQQLQMQQVQRPTISPVSKESMQLDQLQLSVATLGNQMQQVVKSLGNLDERLTSLETKIDTVILKQRTLEDISRDNNRLIQKREESKPVATQPITAEIYGIPPSNYQPQPTTSYPSSTGPYNIPMGTPIQAQSVTPTQYPAVPTNQYNATTNAYSSPPQSTRPPPTVTAVRPSNPPSNSTGSLYPGVQSTQPPPKPAQGARVTVKFDERLINDALAMGFERTMIVDTLYELYGAGQPANDINLLVDKLSAKVGR